MGDISLREMFGIVRQYTILPVVEPMGLRQIVATLSADGVTFPIDGVSCRDLWGYLAGPKILQIICDPPPDHQGDTWTSDIVNGKVWLKDSDGPRFAWVQVESPDTEFDAPLIGAAGRVINPEVSGTDFYFHHPFGNDWESYKDWECYVVVDPRYRALLSPAHGATGVADYREAAKKAPLAPKTGSHQGVLGVEFDAHFVPDSNRHSYRPLENDRIAVFGRWIIDAGHNFHTEIHPPLLMVTASASSANWTTVKVISRPYLVSQAWPEGSFRDHMMAEVKKAISFNSDRLEAHPGVWTVPFRGSHTMTMVLRTLTPPPAGKPLQVEYALTARSGVSVAMFYAPPDGVQIVVTFDSANYKAARLPPSRDRSFDTQQLAAEGGFGTEKIIAEVVGTALLPPVGIHWDYVSSRGVLTDSYDLTGPYWPPSLGQFILANAADLNGAISVPVADTYPFPLYGQVHVFWLTT